MMYFITLLQATKNGNSILYRWFTNHNRLETTLQGSILFNVLAVLIQSSSTNAAQLTTSHHWLQQIAGIHSTVGSTSTYHSVYLINKQQNLSIRFYYLVENGFQSFLKLTPILGTSHQSTHIQGEQGLVLQGLRHIASHNSPSQSLYNSGFTNTWLTNQHRVVLGTAGQNLNGSSNFIITANNWIQLALTSHLGQITAVFFQSLVTILWVGRVYILLSVFLNGVGYTILGQAKSAANISSLVTAILHNSQQQMLSADIIILHAVSQLLRFTNNSAQLHAHGQSILSLDTRNLPQLLLHSFLQHTQVNISFLEDCFQQPLWFLSQGQQHMKAGDFLMVMQSGILLSSLQCIQNSLSIFFLFHNLSTFHNEMISFNMVLFF